MKKFCPPPMRIAVCKTAFVAGLLARAMSLSFAQFESREAGPIGWAPPAAPPRLYQSGAPSSERASVAPLSSVPPGLTLYSIGDPTPDEQLYLEYINRARAQPAAEAQLFLTTTDPAILRNYKAFEVDLALMVAQFATIEPAPPLSMNPSLTAAARLHSQDMLANQFQGHTGTDGSDIGSRVTAQGYEWRMVSENVFAHAESVWHGHAGFEVDWGGDASTGGIQSPPGHRNTIHDPELTEVGIGVVHGTNGRFGPESVTQDFGRPRTVRPFITGVAYYDLNGNNFYDLGEGIGGVTVLVSGSQFYAVTSASGGYSVPVPADGGYVATFSFPGQPGVEKSAVVSESQNVKVDFVPAYSPPQITGSDRPAIGRDNTYQFTAIGGAQSYQWKQNRRIPATETEGAEAGLTKVTASISPGYDVIDRTVRASGSSSFHLAHPQQQHQVLTLDRLFRVGPESQLMFSSRLGWAGSAQVARAQVSLDEGRTWQNVWEQTGSEGRGETSFSTKTISLSAFAGEEISLRFRYDFEAGTFFDQTDPGVGLYLDDITVTRAEELLEEAVFDLSPTTLFSFRPEIVGDYSLRVRPKISDRFLPWGPAKLVTAETGSALPEPPRITRVEVLSGQRLQIEFLIDGSAGGTPEIERAPSLSGPWAPITATNETLTPGAMFRAIVPTGTAAQQFYRISVK